MGNAEFQDALEQNPQKAEQMEMVMGAMENFAILIYVNVALGIILGILLVSGAIGLLMKKRIGKTILLLAAFLGLVANVLVVVQVLLINEQLTPEILASIPAVGLYIWVIIYLLTAREKLNSVLS